MRLEGRSFVALGFCLMSWFVQFCQGHDDRAFMFMAAVAIIFGCAPVRRGE